MKLSWQHWGFELDAGAFDVSLTGFDATEIDELMNQWYSKEAVQDELMLIT